MLLTDNFWIQACRATVEYINGRVDTYLRQCTVHNDRRIEVRESRRRGWVSQVIRRYVHRLD